MLFIIKNRIYNYINNFKEISFYNTGNKNNKKNKNKYYKILIFFIILVFKFFNFSYKYNIVQIQYNISFYDKNKILIKPSDLTLFNKLHILCNIKKKNNSMDIISLAYIFQNRQYICVNYFRIKEKIKFGIKIVEESNENLNKTIYFFSSKILNYKKKFINNKIFNPFIIKKKYKDLYKKIKTLDKEQNISNFSLGLKKLYIKKPYFLHEINNLIKNNIWHFKNIYNKYFCFCKGICKYSNIPKLCKYRFYLYIIENNKKFYNKTDYLFSDFYFLSSDDAFPIFKEMIKQNLSAHYMDEKINLYEKFCGKKKNCLKVIPMININGDFLEKYLDLILKLKAVVAGHPFYSFYNIFYYIDYITYINLGHGVKYFKHFLYNEYSSYKKFNKLLLPPSRKIISIAKKYGWTDNNIIKICLPKWDKYDAFKQNYLNNKKKDRSIFIMFTWRNLKKIKYKISSIYFNGIIDLINDNILINVLKENNIIIFFCLHPNFKIYKNKIKINKLIKYVENSDISDCLMKSSLIVSDFSSVIFDMIYQGKPYIMFIPDAYDNKIKYIYENGYFEIINSLKNGTIHFENKYFNVNETVNKIIYYIKNNFILEPKLKKFYDSFEFNCKNSTNRFINYLLNDI